MGFGKYILILNDFSDARMLVPRMYSQGLQSLVQYIDSIIEYSGTTKTWSTDSSVDNPVDQAQVKIENIQYIRYVYFCKKILL